MKVLVTGATGFIGSNLVRHLLQRGDEVRILKRPATEPVLLKGLPLEVADGDLADVDAVARAANDVEGIYHVAGLVSYWRHKHPQQWQVNVLGTRNVVQAAIQAGVRRVVHTSSIAALPSRDDGLPADETTPWRGQPYGSGYAKTKHEAEREALKGADRGLEVVIVNPGLTFGEGDLNLNATRLFRMVDGRPVVLSVGGTITTCDADDVCAGHIAAMQRGRAGERYILGGECRSYSDLLGDAADVMGRRVHVTAVPRAFAEVTARAVTLAWGIARREPPITPEFIWLTTGRRCYSSARAVRELDYPQTPLRQSLEKACRWYRENSRRRPRW